MIDGLMKGKRGLVMGVANERSIAWGIASALAPIGTADGLPDAATITALVQRLGKLDDPRLVGNRKQGSANTHEVWGGNFLGNDGHGSAPI